MKEVPFDLILLDVDMPELDGIKFGKLLRARNDSTEIIFVSDREEKVFESFSVQPFGFVRKSRFLKDISVALQAFIQKIQKKDKEEKLVFDGKYGIITIAESQLMYIEGNAKNQLLHVEGKKEPFVVHSSLEIVEKQLLDKGFIRCHKGYIVNYRYISAIMKDSVELSNGEQLPLSRRKVNDVRQKYLSLSDSDGSVLF
jgi:DNA-binding LytR/AlgR family response regulator